MRRIQVWIVLGFTAATCIARAQQSKAGLWELTTVMTFQQSPLVPGSPAAAAASRPRIRQVCITQEQIDKYGAIVPLSGNGCRLDKIVRSPHSMSADLVCAGRVNGTGTMRSTFTAESASGKAHFVGSIQQDPKPIPIEWTTNVTSVFKSANCGDVKPAPIPEPAAPSK